MIVDPLFALLVNATDAPPFVGVTVIEFADGVPNDVALAGDALPFVAVTSTRKVAARSPDCTT